MFVYTFPGFQGATVTKLYLYLQAVIPILVSLLSIQYLFDLQISPHLLIWQQWWRVPINQLIFIASSEAAVSFFYFYNMRIIERLYGSRKYLSYLVLVYFLSLLIIPLGITLLSHLPILASVFYKLASLHIRPGSMSLVFATLVLYKELIPPIYKFQITPVSAPFVITLTDKSSIYILAADLLLLGLPGSLLPALCGWTLGNLIFFEVIPGKNWRIPRISSFGKSRSRPTYSQTEYVPGQDSSSSSTESAIPNM